MENTPQTLLKNVFFALKRIWETKIFFPPPAFTTRNHRPNTSSKDSFVLCQLVGAKIECFRFQPLCFDGINDCCLASAFLNERQVQAIASQRNKIKIFLIALFSPQAENERDRTS